MVGHDPSSKPTHAPTSKNYRRTSPQPSNKPASNRKHRPHHRRHRTSTLHRTTRRNRRSQSTRSPPVRSLPGRMYFPQVLVRDAEHDGRHHLTLAVNDARRKQLYFTLLDDNGYEVGAAQAKTVTQTLKAAVMKTLIDMDIDYPESIARRVNEVLEQLRQSDANVEYVSMSSAMERRNTRNRGQVFPEGGMVSDHALLDEGASGLDVSRLSPLRNSLGESGADRTVVSAQAGRVGAEPVEACAQPCRCGTYGGRQAHDR